MTFPRSWPSSVAACIAAAMLDAVSGGALAGAVDRKDCSFKGRKLQGRVQSVNAFPDLKVQIVGAHADLRVQRVEAFPDSCGKWQWVDAFPDFKVQFVEAFPDLKIEYVNAFPGVP